jgi:hypothetical protein
LLKSFASCRWAFIVVAAAVVAVVMADIYEACVLQYKKHLYCIHLQNYTSVAITDSSFHISAEFYRLRWILCNFFSLVYFPETAIQNIKIKMYWTMLLPLLYELKLGLSHRGWTQSNEFFYNRALKKMFWATREEVTANWKKLHIEEFYDLCSSRNII